MNLNNILLRSDAEKWSNPEIVDGFVMNMVDAKTYESIFNTTVPFETRKANVESMINMYREVSAPLDPDTTTIVTAPGCDAEPEASVELTIYTPKDAKPGRPVMLDLPGGGLYMCTPFTEPLAILSEKACGATVVGVRYRTCFDEGGGYPGTINDVEAAFKWVVDNAADQGYDPEKIVIYGLSSGGHLALAASHRLKSRGYYGHMPRCVVVIDPIPDDRTIYPSSKREQPAWGGRDLYASCQTWLGYEHANSATVPAEAFANHATPEECVGLPPTFININDQDVSLDPCMVYSSKLAEAGVYFEIHVWGGAAHCVPYINLMGLGQGDVPYVKRYWDTFAQNIKESLQYDLRRQWIPEAVEA